MESKTEDIELARLRSKEALTTFGDYAIILRKKTSGVKCSCYDDDRGSGVSDCTSCYGTGFVGGYDKDTNIYRMVLTLPTMAIKVTKYGIIVDDSPSGWLAYDCPIKQGDVIWITDETGQDVYYRFWVKQIIPEFLFGRENIVKMKLDLVFINPGDPLYGLT